MQESSAKKPGGGMARHVSPEARRRAMGNFARFDYGMTRGHREYCLRAQRCERFYLGGGLQWEPQDAAEMIASGRRPAEQNEIMQMVNTAIGYQIANRMDIAVRPRGRGADDATATVFGKVIKQVADNTKLHWRETEVFANGMIRERGYFDVRMGFDSNILGEIEITTPYPDDVIPDPDGNAYDPDEWADVTLARYYTLNQIEQLFGKPARAAVKLYSGSAETDVDELRDVRDRFGERPVGEFAFYCEAADLDSTTLYRVVDRQYRVYEPVLCAVYPNGDIRQIPNATPAQKAEYAKQGAAITKRMQRRVKWLVSTMNAVLFDDYSPYPWFTIVPFFPYFRHGKTRGLVTNAISIQESVNKAVSSIGHVLSSVANSGWAIEAGSLDNMTDDEAVKRGAENGIVFVYKKGYTPPKRIDPPSPPAGLFEYVAMQVNALKNSTGMDESLTASGPIGDQSGVAYQARQFAAQQKLAVPLDNLGRTRHLLAERIVWLIQNFMDAPQVLRIIEIDPFGEEKSVELPINQPEESAEGLIKWLNDLTVGEYDIVISEQPMQITFDNSQFEQLKALREMEYPIPPEFALRYTNLSDKAELAKAVQQASVEKANPLDEAKVKLMEAQTAKLVEELVNKRIEAIYAATQAGAQIASMPAVASLADEVLQSSGFNDQNAAPIIPQGVDPAMQVGAGLTQAAPAQPTVAPTSDAIDPTDKNTNPLTPEGPGVGMHAGIEAMGAQV